MSGQKVPKGYKQTEVGVIPEDWDVSSIRDFASIKTGPFGTLLKASEYSEYEGVPLISVGEIRNGFLRITEHTPRISENVTRRLPQYVLREGDIVFGRKGAVERSALIKPEQEGWFLGSDGISVRSSMKNSYKYIAVQFQSHQVINWLTQNAIGTTMASLNQNILGRVIIPLPPTIAEQEAIAQALSDTDALIESLEQLLTKKRQIKQGAMQELLTGKRRLPGFSHGQGYKQTEIGIIPEDWEPARLGDMAEVIMGQSPGGLSYNKNGVGIPLINGPTEFTEKYPVKVQWTTEPTKLCQPNDLLLCVRGSSTGRMNVANDRFCIGRGVAAIRGNSRSSTEYLTYQIYLVIEDLLALVTGSTFPSVDGRAIKSIPIPCPITAEQNAIATILSDMDSEIASLEAKLAKTRQLKQGMMHELLTGRIRLV
jgi:type I restriction enzyme, S subunit